MNDPLCSIPIKGVGCTAGIISLCITTKGSIFPCSKLRIPVGNILDEKLKEIWKKSEFLKKLRNRNNLKGKCKYCSYREYCGGCRAIANTINGDPLSEDPFCFKTKK